MLDFGCGVEKTTAKGPLCIDDFLYRLCDNDLDGSFYLFIS
jgi:hypothetical protein